MFIHGRRKRKHVIVYELFVNPGKENILLAQGLFITVLWGEKIRTQLIGITTEQEKYHKAFETLHKYFEDQNENTRRNKIYKVELQV